MDTDSVDTTVAQAPEVASEILQAARATKSIVDATANLLLMGIFPGNACIQIGNSYNFLKQFSEKMDGEIKQLEIQEGLVNPSVQEAAVKSSSDLGSQAVK